MLIRPLAQPRLKKALAQKISPDGMLLATGGLKRGQVQVPEGATFYAPLSLNTMDYVSLSAGTFARNSEGLYESAGLWRIAGDDAPRFENGQLLMEPAITNKCQNYNMEVDEALTGLTYSGDGAGVMRRVNDEAAIAAAGFSGLSNGFVIELDNSAGSGDGRIDIDGPFANTNVHTISAWCRRVSGSGTCDIRNNGNNFFATFDQPQYERIIATGAPSGPGQEFRLRVPAGTVARMFVNQNEEFSVPSSEIITQGASASRARDSLEYDNALQFFSNTQGMMLITWSPRFTDPDALGAGINGILTVNPSIASQMYLQTSGAVIGLKAFDGANARTLNLAAHQANDVMKLALRWVTTPTAEMQLGYQRNGEAWVWSATQTYAGAWTSGGAVTDIMSVMGNINAPAHINGIQIYDEDRGTAWIEGNYP